MKISKQKIKRIIYQVISESKKFKVKANGKKNAIKKALYGNPKTKKDLRESLEKDHGKIVYCKTCSAYDTSKEAKDQKVASKDTGFCHMFGFSCKETNSCTGWYRKWNLTNQSLEN